MTPEDASLGAKDGLPPVRERRIRKLRGPVNSFVFLRLFLSPGTLKAMFARNIEMT